MRLVKLSLTHFRNISSKKIIFDEKLTCFVGPNAKGKTNILESIYFLLTGKGMKEEKQEELIMFNEHSTDVEGLLSNSENEVLLRIHMEKKDRIEKIFMVNKIKRQRFTYLKDTIPCVLFSPSLISIIDGQPAERRHFIDTIIETVDFEYKKRLNNYENGLRKRNRVIEKADDISQLRSELHFWDSYLIENAHYIVEKRKEIISQINAHPIENMDIKIEYIPNIISKTTLEESFMKQFYQKRTLVGPQRDEYIFMYRKNSEYIDAQRYCSRGEQRLALFWSILQQLFIYVEALDKNPILLLDDIFSELDNKNKHLITTHIAQFQTIITTTEEELIENEHLKGSIMSI